MVTNAQPLRNHYLQAGRKDGLKLAGNFMLITTQRQLHGYVCKVTSRVFHILLCLQTHPSKNQHSVAIPQIHATSVNSSNINQPASLQNQFQSTGILSNTEPIFPATNENPEPLPVSLSITLVLIQHFSAS